MEKKKILVVAAHPDDEILGVAGTIKKYVDRGHEARCIILGEGITSRKNASSSDVSVLHNNTLKACRKIGYKQVGFSDFPDNRFDSVDLLEIIKEIEKHIDEYKPDIVYTHHGGDLNVDHRRTYEAVLTACRPIGDYSVKEIYAFETPSSTEWQFGTMDKLFNPNVFIDIEETIEAKLEAMSYYETEIRNYPHPRSLEALKIIATRWGIVVGKKYIEAFELIRKND